MTITDCPGCGAPVSSLTPGARCTHCNQVLVPITKKPTRTRTAHRVRPLGLRPIIGWLILVTAANVPIVLSYTTDYGRVPFTGMEGAVFAGMISGIAAGAFLLRGHNLLGALLAVTIGVLLFCKPMLAPMMSSWNSGDYHPYSFTSETHLHFVLPGLALLTIPLLRFFFFHNNKKL